MRYVVPRGTYKFHNLNPKITFQFFESVDFRFFFVLKFHEPLWSSYCPVLKNQPERLVQPCQFVAILKGLMEFQSTYHFSSSFMSKMSISRLEILAHLYNEFQLVQLRLEKAYDQIKYVGQPNILCCNLNLSKQQIHCRFLVPDNTQKILTEI